MLQGITQQLSSGLMLRKSLSGEGKWHKCTPLAPVTSEIASLAFPNIDCFVRFAHPFAERPANWFLGYTHSPTGSSYGFGPLSRNSEILNYGPLLQRSEEHTSELQSL